MVNYLYIECFLDMQVGFIVAIPITLFVNENALEEKKISFKGLE